MALIDRRNVNLKIQDGNGNELTIRFHEFTMSWTETYNWEYVRDRGRLDSTRSDDDDPMTVEFTGQFDYIKGPTMHGDTGISDALTGKGEASDWVSADDRVGYECEPYCVNLVLENEPDCVPSGQSDAHEHITFERFRPTSIDVDVAEGTISVSGECNSQRPTSVRMSPSS